MVAVSLWLQLIVQPLQEEGSPLHNHMYEFTQREEGGVEGVEIKHTSGERERQADDIHLQFQLFCQSKAEIFTFDLIQLLRSGSLCQVSHRQVGVRSPFE